MAYSRLQRAGCVQGTLEAFGEKSPHAAGNQVNFLVAQHWVYYRIATIERDKGFQEARERGQISNSQLILPRSTWAPGKDRRNSRPKPAECPYLEQRGKRAPEGRKGTKCWDLPLGEEKVLTFRNGAKIGQGGSLKKEQLECRYKFCTVQVTSHR